MVVFRLLGFGDRGCALIRGHDQGEQGAPHFEILRGSLGRPLRFWGSLSEPGEPSRLLHYGLVRWSTCPHSANAAAPPPGSHYKQGLRWTGICWRSVGVK